MITFKQKTYSEGDVQHFLRFIGVLSGFILQCKALHWSAPKKGIHQYLDEFFSILGEIQDTIAEGYMGILGKMGPNDVPYTPCNAHDAMTFIDEVIRETEDFYRGIPDGTEFKGLTSETETFINNCRKHKYLFSLCDNDYSKE